MQEHEYEQEIDLREVFLLLKHNLIAIVATTLVSAIVGLMITMFLITPQYEASATMIVNTRQDQSATVTNDQIMSAKNLVSTYSIIVRSDTVLMSVINNLKLSETYEELSKKVVVSAVDATQVMRISYQNPDPQYAKTVVQEITKVAPGVIQDMVEAGSVKVISEARVGTEPVSPSIKKNTAIAGILGMVLSVSVVLIKELFNNTFKTSEDIQSRLGLTVLGVIPEID